MVDEPTSDALRLFNARLGAQAENEKAERRVQKTAKAKDDAAGRVRNLENDTKATAEQRAEAAAAYRAAVDTWEHARTGEADLAPTAPAVFDDTTDDTTDDAAPEALAVAAPAEQESADEPERAAPADH